MSTSKHCQKIQTFSFRCPWRLPLKRVC